jgi:hypothetical protein
MSSLRVLPPLYRLRESTYLTFDPTITSGLTLSPFPECSGNAKEVYVLCGSSTCSGTWFVFSFSVSYPLPLAANGRSRFSNRQGLVFAQDERREGCLDRLALIRQDSYQGCTYPYPSLLCYPLCTEAHRIWRLHRLSSSTPSN